MIESKFWEQMRQHLPIDYMERVENGVNNGMPDVHFLESGLSGWMELKAEEKFPSKIDFQPGQPIWLDQYCKMGGTAFIVLHVKETGTIYIWEGLDAMTLKEKGGTMITTPILVVDRNQHGWEAIAHFLSQYRPRYRVRSQRMS